MSRTCTICTHSDRKAIESALVAGEPSRVIASRYGTIGRMALQRHKEEHLPKRLAKAQDARESANADELLRHVKGLQSKATSLLLQAERTGDIKTALAGVRESRGCIELLAKLMGELDERPQFNVTINPQWIELRAVIVQALEPYPDAGQAVAAALNGSPS